MPEMFMEISTLVPTLVHLSVDSFHLNEYVLSQLVRNPADSSTNVPPRLLSITIAGCFAPLLSLPPLVHFVYSRCVRPQCPNDDIYGNRGSLVAVRFQAGASIPDEEEFFDSFVDNPVVARCIEEYGLIVSVREVDMLPIMVDVADELE